MALFNYECDEIKRKIDEVSPNYPQLTTFEKEWLFFHKYHYIPGIPVELECETVSVNPYGSVLNAIPFRYKSAILKGNTLVNVSKSAAGNNNVIGSYWSIGTSDFLKPNTKYFCWVKNLSNDTYDYYFNNVAFNQTFGFRIGYNQTITRIMTTKEKPATIWLSSSSTNTATTPQQLQIMLIEYQEGMENWDIPYFEGMQSVKMPVLTTSNEDGTKTNILTVNEHVTLRSNGDICDELNLLTGQLTQRIGEDGVVLSQEVVKTVDLNKLTKPYEGTNHYQVTANIPCEAILEVPVVSTGKQTLEEINN